MCKCRECRKGTYQTKLTPVTESSHHIPAVNGTLDEVPSAPRSRAKTLKAGGQTYVVVGTIAIRHGGGRRVDENLGLVNSNG